MAQERVNIALAWACVEYAPCALNADRPASASHTRSGGGFPSTAAWHVSRTNAQNIMEDHLSNSARVPGRIDPNSIADYRRHGGCNGFTQSISNVARYTD